jgi:hypothetical protein
MVVKGKANRNRNKMKKTLRFLSVAILVIAIAGAYVFPQVQTQMRDVFGVSAGPTHTEHQEFLSDATIGGAVYATTTTAATETLTASVLERNKVIRMLGSATAAAITVTLPATSTMSHIMPRPGDFRTWVIENGYTAAATTTTIAAGTGIDLQEPDGQNVVIGINNYAFLTCFREVSSDIVCLVDESIPAD